jgi:hypothetical protein
LLNFCLGLLFVFNSGIDLADSLVRALALMMATFVQIPNQD